MSTHHLKTWPEYFEPLLHGEKTFEVRKDDRGFKVGDLLALQEWVPEDAHGKGHYTGQTVWRRVTYILKGGILGIEPGYVVMGLDGPEEF